MRVLVALLLTLSLLPRDSSAEPLPRPFIMGDLSSTGYAGAEMTLGQIDFEGQGDVNLFLVDLVGEFPIAPSFELFLRLPVAFADWDSGLLGDDDSGLGIGNLTLGGRFVSVSGGPQSNTAFGVGASFSGLTASDEDDEGLAVAFAGAFSLFEDAGYYAIDTNTIRVFGDFRWSQGGGFFQGHLALLHLELDEDIAGDDDLNLLRIGLGGGARVSPALAIIGELISTASIDQDDDEFVHLLVAGIRHDGFSLTFGAHVYMPIDDEQPNTDYLGIGIDVLSRF